MSTTCRDPLPTGDRETETTEQGSLYADPKFNRVVRFSDPENHPDKGYRVEVWSLGYTTEDGERVEEIQREMKFWAFEAATHLAKRDDTEYLGGHCFDGCGPHGTYTDTSGHPCPRCGMFMQKGHYQTDYGTYPGLVCPDNHGRLGHCPGHMDTETLHENGGFITAAEYVERRFGGEN